MKKIAFLISDQHLIPHGGIGQFCKSFTELMLTMGHEVDIISDRKPKEPFAYSLISDNTKLYYTSDPLPYTEYNTIYLYRKGVNFERIINFQRSLKSMLQNKDYDLIIVNGDEALASVFPLKLDIPVLFYTHFYRQIFPEKLLRDNFIKGYHQYFDSMFYSMRHIDIGTQSDYNCNKLKLNGIKTTCHKLPMPMPERNLLEPNYNERKGVLYIGRWEEGKNPKAFVDMIDKTRLPAKILTNNNGKLKFMNAFKEINFTDYDIRVKIVGEEKNNFIKSCKVAYNCSLFENYSFAFTETAGHMPVVVLDDQQWTNNFDPKLYTKVSEDKAAETILEKYKIEPTEYYKTGNLDHIKMLDQQAPILWEKFLAKL